MRSWYRRQRIKDLNRHWALRKSRWVIWDMKIRWSKIINNPEEFHWHDEYATLNFFRFICKNIGNLGNGEIEKMVTRLKSIDQKAVENHVNGAVWAFDYDKMFCVLMENEICRKVCEKNKYNSWMNLIGQYCVSRT